MFFFSFINISHHLDLKKLVTINSRLHHNIETYLKWAAWSEYEVTRCKEIVKMNGISTFAITQELGIVLCKHIPAHLSIDKQSHEANFRFYSWSFAHQDKSYFADRHRCLGTDGTFASMKLNYYPALGTREVKEGQIRCGKHSDFGSITLLLQDMQGGLEAIF